MEFALNLKLEFHKCFSFRDKEKYALKVEKRSWKLVIFRRNTAETVFASFRSGTETN